MAITEKTQIIANTIKKYTLTVDVVDPTLKSKGINKVDFFVFKNTDKPITAINVDYAQKGIAYDLLTGVRLPCMDLNSMESDVKRWGISPEDQAELISKIRKFNGTLTSSVKEKSPGHVQQSEITEIKQSNSVGTKIGGDIPSVTFGISGGSGLEITAEKTTLVKISGQVVKKCEMIYGDTSGQTLNICGVDGGEVQINGTIGKNCTIIIDGIDNDINGGKVKINGIIGAECLIRCKKGEVEINGTIGENCRIVNQGFRRGLTINSAISQGCTIEQYAMGSVKIQGSVSENVIFNCNTGDIVFASRPPESVVKKISRYSGRAIMPDAPLAPPPGGASFLQASSSTTATNESPVGKTVAPKTPATPNICSFGYSGQGTAISNVNVSGGSIVKGAINGENHGPSC